MENIRELLDLRELLDSRLPDVRVQNWQQDREESK